MYSDFSYTDSSGTTSFGDIVGTVWESPGGGCPIQAWPAHIFVTSNAAILFTPSGATGGSAVYEPAGILYPAYKITSIVYAPPGNKSSNGYTNSITNGTTTSIGHSFQAGNSTTYTSGGDFLGFGGTLSVTFGASTTSGNTSAFTETFTQGTGVSLASVSTNPNAINHGQDLFVIWLNPAVSIIPDGSGAGIYSIGTQSQPNGQLEGVDQVEVTAQTMMANAQGVTTIPLSILGPQNDSSGNPTLPGLANICVNHVPPPDCTLTNTNQCGCVPGDFAAILATDPLLSYSSTESPLNADTSGVTACSDPGPTDKCRYVPVFSAPGSGVQASSPLVGPECEGCDSPNNPFTQTDANQQAQTFNENFGVTVQYSWRVDLGDEIGGPTLASTNSFTWTESESTGQINGTSNSMTVTLSSATLGCTEDVLIFEDTVFHTFVFQQPADNASCP